jgi:hypothetical protein
MNPLLAHLLEAAARAPSAHNTQPWVLSWREDELHIRLDRERMLPAADPEGSDAAHSLGAAIENLLLTLSQLGLEGQYSVTGTCESEPVLILCWRKSDGPRPDPSLYRMIPIRSTVRLRYSREPIPGAVLDDITHAALSPSRLYVLTDERAIDEIRSLAALASAKLLENENYARELYRWLRFSRRHPDWYRDGLNSECMGWNAITSAVCRHLLRPAAVRMLTRLHLSRWLYANANQQAPFAPALCLLTASDVTLRGRVDAGRSLQRTWLTAAKHGLVTHPLSAAVDYEQFRRRVFQLFGVAEGEVHVNLFRLGRSGKTPRSPRLTADELLEPATDLLGRLA